jgi:hypothetical protein
LTDLAAPIRLGGSMLAATNAPKLLLSFVARIELR